MIEETVPDIPNFFSKNDYTFFYLRKEPVLFDFNQEAYTLKTGLTDSLIENNPELLETLRYFSEMVSRLQIDEDIKSKSLDTLEEFIEQVLNY